MALSYQQLLTAVPLVIKGGNVPNLVGEAGIGKSALVRDIAHRNHARLFTTVVSLAEKGDLAIPVPPLTSDSFIQTKHYGKLADVKFGYSHTLIQIIKAAERHPEQPIYWFLDEFNRGSHAVQCELMNLVLQREINGLKLPKQVHILIAENPDPSMTGFGQTDYTVFSGDAAIKDRTVRLVMRSDLKSWLEWASSQDDVRQRQMIHPQVIQYLKANPQMLNDPQLSEDLYPTPRAWQRVSDNLYELEQLSNRVRKSIQPDILAGDLGIEVTTAFDRFLSQHEVAITPDRFLTLPVDELKRQFAQLDEAQKHHVVMTVVKSNSELNDSMCQRFLMAMQSMSADGQYSVALTIADQTDFLRRLYQLVKKSDEAAQKLYTGFEKVGFRQL